MLAEMKGFMNLLEAIPFMGMINCEILVMILETKILGTRTEEEIVKKNIEQLGIRFPPIDYSDDPMAFLDSVIMNEVMKVLNEVITPMVKVILEELGLLCQGLNIDTPLENDEDTDPNYDELEDLLDDLNQIFEPGPNPTNFPGDGSLFANLDPSTRSNINGILGDIMAEMGGSSKNPLGPGGMPVTPRTINVLKNLLDVVSNILRPTELCTLLSGTASVVTLRIILKLIQQR